MLNDARLAAPELAVDTFLRVVESKKVTDPVWRKEILEEALRISADVKYPVRREVVRFSKTPVDTVAGYMSYAYDQKLDALSLKARVIKDLLRDDKDRARQLAFQMGGDLHLKPLTCEDALAYNVADIYGAVGAVADVVFTKKEIDEGLRAPFILPWIENIESPAQIVPASGLLSQWTGSAIEKQMLFNALTRAINRSFNDDRSFSHVLRQDRLFMEIARPGFFDLRPAFREFLYKNATSTRCLDSKPGKDQLPSIIADANFLFSDTGKAFVPADFESVEYKGSPDIKTYWRSETSKKIDRDFRSARDVKNEPDNKNDKDAQFAWELKVNSILDELDSWKTSEREPESEVFNQKCVVYRTMSREVDGPLKKTVLRAFLRYLAASPMQKDSFIEWLYHANWIAKTNPQLFSELADEFPNPNFKVMVEAREVGV